MPTLDDILEQQMRQARRRYLRGLLVGAMAWLWAQVLLVLWLCGVI